MNVALLVAIVGLLSLLAADQFNSWNKRRYESQKKEGVSDREAFRRNRLRKATYDRATFWILALAGGLSIYSSFSDKEESDNAIKTLTMKSIEVETQLQGLQAKIDDQDAERSALEGRVRQIETQLPSSQSDANLERVISVEQATRALSRCVVLLDRKVRAMDRGRIAK